MARGPCRNRAVVNVDNRLYSPFYDWEGAPGLAQSAFEFSEADAMCGFGSCGPTDVNAWFNAADHYIDSTLLKNYKKVTGRAEAKFGGAVLPQDLRDHFEKIDEFFFKWRKFKDAFTERSVWENFAHPFTPYWNAEVKKIIVLFDEAACLQGALDSIATYNLDSPGLAEGAPAHAPETPPDGGRWLGGSGQGETGKPSAGLVGEAIGAIAIGAAGYFLFKAMTE